MIYLDNNTFQQEIFIPRSSVKNDASPEYATKNELENAIENEVIRADEKYAAKTDLLPYATTGWVESQDFATKEWTDGQIQSAIASETGRTEETYQKKSEMGIYSTTNEVENMIDGAVSGKMDTSAMSAYTKTENFATINGSAITSGGNIVVEATPYTAGTNIDITDHIISVTGITVPTKVSELVNDSGYITTADTQNFVTSGDVQTQINDSISGKADSSAVTAQISEVKTEIEAKIPSKVSSLENDLNFVNSGDVKTQVESYNYINSGQAQTQIDNSISGKLDTDTFTAYTANTQTELNNKQDASGMTAYATTAFTESTYLKEHQSLSAYTPTSGFSTINGNVITDGGNIVVEEAPYSGGTNIDITDHIISVTGITIPTSNTAFTNDAGYVTSGEVEAQITSKGYITGYTETDPVFQASAASGISEQDITNWNNKLDSSALTPYYTSAQTDTAISNATSGKQDTLVSGTNIKTINNQSLLGSGNIEIQGGSGGGSYTAGNNIDITNDVISVTGLATINGSAITEGGNIVIQGGGGSGGGETVIELTQAQYDALTEYAQDTTYIITDAPSIDLDNYYTSAQTESAITAQTSLKQDTLVSGTNIKTINGQSILGNGDIYISQGINYNAGAGLNLINGNTFEVKDYENLKQGARLSEIEKVISIALNDLNNRLKNLK